MHAMGPAAGATERHAMKYWAFLSYSHADEAVAARLHRALEQYTLPASVRRAHGLPRRLIPVFRDIDELEAAAGLGGRLQEALDDSRWLIVLCSKAAAQSKYVNAEVEYFLGKYGAERVLCVLLDADASEAFPPALRKLDDEPLAADLRSGADFELAMLKLIAAMATVGFTELRNREAQRSRRQRMLAAAVVAAASLGTLAYWDLFQREHTEYYSDYVRRHGIWEGVGPVSAGALPDQGAYRFVRSGRWNPPDRVSLIDARGGCHASGMNNLLAEQPEAAKADPAQRYCAASFSYSSRRTLLSETFENALGEPAETLSYAGNSGQFRSWNGVRTPSLASGIRYVHFRRDRQGYDLRVAFMTEPGSLQPTTRGYYAVETEYDARGRVLRQSWLDGDPKVILKALYSPALFSTGAAIIEGQRARNRP